MHHQLKRRKRKGSALLEFTLIGIPMVFIWLSILEMSRGMWQSETLQYAAKTTTSFAAVHGATCALPNNCAVNVSDVVGVFSTFATGLPLSQVTLTLTSQSGSVVCNPVSTCSSNGAWNTMWPPASGNDNRVGNWIKIRADYTLSTALGMFFPGSKPTQFSSGSGLGQFALTGYGYQLIQF